MFEEIVKGYQVNKTILTILTEFHLTGPVNPAALEALAHAKRKYPEVFETYEPKILAAMGLFYKSGEPQSLFEEIYSVFADTIEEETGQKFTPVQASAYKEIHDNRYFSFSAPTSAGKSHLFRSLISETKGDIVIVVPSRALISEYYYDVLELVDKSVLVLQFIDNINIAKTKRRVFIITPERGAELFQRKKEFNIELFLLDEAQISEEPVRGMKFDSFVRRIDKVFPDAKKVFAHPFVANPEAQLMKHGFNEDAAAYKYDQQAVGKIFISFDKESSVFSYFTPNSKALAVPAKGDLVAEEMKKIRHFLYTFQKGKFTREST